MSIIIRLTGQGVHMVTGVQLRRMAVNEEIDYLFLKNALKDYISPRSKITSLLKQKTILRIKKGLYIFGKEYALHPYVKESLANLIYGPSYVSLEYALAFYGFIPEWVEILTSVTNKKDKRFSTPVGMFTYRYLHPKKYPIGVTQIFYDATHPILIATPEKALADKMLLETSHLNLTTEKELKTFLFDDLRIPLHKIKELDVRLFNQIAELYQNKNISRLNQFLKKRKK